MTRGYVDELGECDGLRKIVCRSASRFWRHAVVYRPLFRVNHYHDTQDEPTSSTAALPGRGGRRDTELGPGGLVHVKSTTPRRVSNASESDDLVLVIVGGNDGYV